jgi:hypothetical protein
MRAWLPVLASLAAAASVPTCGAHDAHLAALARAYGKAPAGESLARDGRLLKLLVSADGKTWGIVKTRPDGWVCTVDHGWSWRDKSPPKAGEPS